MGGTTFGTLSSIGSDLSVSVSFNIANELLDAANDAQMGQDELIALVVGFTIVFSALQARMQALLRARRRLVVATARAEAESVIAELRAAEAAEPRAAGQLWGKQDELHMKDAERSALAKLQDRRSALDFGALIVSICQRIFLAISIQLLAASVRTQQPSRLVRTISLVGLAVFFVFVEALTHRVAV
jgi:hypothetical protein